MSWDGYIAFFFVGIFGGNGLPHFVQGICGNRFQTPFASPPGKGESSPLVNVMWGWFNFLVAGVLLYYFATPPVPALAWALTALGALVVALALATHFGNVRNTPPRP